LQTSAAINKFANAKPKPLATLLFLLILFCFIYPDISPIKLLA